jgi:hypothetical protein
LVKRKGFKILWLRNIEPPPSHIHHKGGIHNIVLRDIDHLLVFIVRRRGFKILWLRNIDPLPIHLKGGIQNIVIARYGPPVGFHRWEEGVQNFMAAKY